MEELHSHQEEKNKRRGMLLSIVVHIGLVLLALLPLLTYPDPPPGQEGIVVNLGMIDIGEGEENAGPAEPAVEEPLDVPEEEAAPPEEMEPTPADPEPVKEREVVTTEDPEEIAFKKEEEKRKKQQEEELRRQREEEDARRRAEAEAKRKADEEARKKAEDDARRKAEADQLKDQIGGLFGAGEGKGKTGKEGNQGDPGGDPDATKLEGISTGAGTIGGGLKDRGVLAAPKVEDDTQKQGTVTIEVCVDENGSVIGTPTYTQRNSTTSDSDLIRIAVNNAKKWKFSKGTTPRQCGTITYRFIVR